MKRSGVRLAIVVGVLVLAPLAACLMLGLLAAGAAGLAAFLPEPALAPDVVLGDDDYRVRLRVPRDWVPMDAQDVQSTDMQALVGVVRTGDHWALLSAHAAPQTLAPGALDEYARVLIDPESTLLPGERPISVAGVWGRAARYESPAMGRVVWAVSFARPGWAYHLFGVEGDPADGYLEELAAGVELLEGEPTGRARGSRQDRRSRSWRIGEERFESAETGLVVDVSGGWSARAGDLGVGEEDAEVALTTARDALILLDPRPAGEHAQQADYLGDLPTTADSLDFVFEGRPARAYEFAPVSSAFFGRLAIVLREQGFVRVIATGYSRDDVDAALLALGERVSFLDAEGTLALRRELEGTEVHDRAAGPGWYVRGDRYLSLHQGFSFTRPIAGVRVREDDGLELYVRRAELHGFAYGVAQAELSGWREQARIPADAETCVAPEGECARFEEEVRGVPWQSLRFTRASSSGGVIGGLSYPGPRSAERDQLAAALLLGFDTQPPTAEAVSESNASRTDGRLGYRFESPWPSARPVAVDSATDALRGAWQIDGPEGASISLTVQQAWDGAGESCSAWHSISEQMSDIAVAPGVVWTPEPESTLSGHPARCRAARFLFSELRTCIVRVDRIAYGLSMSRPVHGATSMAQMEASLTLLR